jgi:phosphatidylserine/phosphatidylglycerophosphate/cardiolipin synthase-like enzyme
VVVVCGQDIAKKFITLVQSARAGSLLIVTPFINDFEIRKSKVSSRIMNIARMNSKINLMVAPPGNGHKTHASSEELVRCGKCVAAAKKIALLDVYSKFAEDIQIKDNLHAKVYIASNARGDSRCLTGSVNLTTQAFNVYCELGIYTSDKLIIKQIRNITNKWQVEKTNPVQEYRMWRKDFFAKYPPVKDLVEQRLVK